MQRVSLSWPVSIGTSGQPCQILVFDGRRGNTEGEEQDKLLAFSPSSTPLNEQSQVAGLFQGLCAFSSNFTQEEHWDVAETNQSIWTLMQVEPSIYYGLAVTKATLPRHVTLHSLQACIEHAYSLTRLLNGSIQSLLESDSSGELARTAVQAALNFVALQLGNTNTWVHRELRNPFTSLATVPKLRLPSANTAAVHSVCIRIIRGSSGLIQDIFLLHQNLVLWNSLGREDCIGMYSLVASCFLPGGPILQHKGDIPAILYTDSWEQLESGFLGLRAAIEREDIDTHTLPVVHLHSGTKRRLLPYNSGNLLALLLVNEDAASKEQTISTVKDTVASGIRDLQKVLVETNQPATDPGHVHNYRYVCQHDDDGSVVASPRSKVSAMSHHARAAVVATRDSMDRIGDDATEVWAKTSQGMLVTAVQTHDKVLVAVRDSVKPAALGAGLKAMNNFVETTLM